MRRLILALLLGGGALLGQCAITGIDVSEITHSSALIKYAASGVCWSQVRFGVVSNPASGDYSYQSNMIVTGIGQSPEFALGGLAPSTVYYYVATAWTEVPPNVPPASTRITSAQFSFTTPAAPTTEQGYVAAPTPPTPVALPREVDTAGYCIVTFDGYFLVDGSACGATDDMTVQQAYYAVTYGTVFRFPQGASLSLPFASRLIFDTKAVQSGKSGVNDPTHQYIVLETTPGAIGSLPPPGVRTGPQYEAALAKIVSPTALGVSPFSEAESLDIINDAHHIVVRNMQFTTNPSASNCSDNLDPLAWTMFLRVRPLGTFTPKYIQLDRLYLKGQPAPCRQGGALVINGQHTALDNSYIDEINFWMPWSYPTVFPTASANTLTIPVMQVQTVSSGPSIGPTSSSTCTVTPTGSPSAYYQIGVGGAGYQTAVYYATPVSGTVSVSCGSALAVQTADGVLPRTHLLWATGTITSSGWGTVANTDVNRELWGARNLAASIGVTNSGTDTAVATGPIRLDNNYIQAAGLTVYFEVTMGGGTSDLTATRNTLRFGGNRQWNNPLTNGRRYYVRQPFETKMGKRLLFLGGVISEWFNLENEGPGIFISDRYYYGTLPGAPNGITDVLIKSNTLRYGANGINCMGAGTIGQHQPSPVARLAIINNLMYDLDRYRFDGGGPSFNSAYFVTTPGCQDMRITNNTMMLIGGKGPYWFGIGGDSTLGGRMIFRDNLAHISQSAQGRIIGQDDNKTYPTQPRLPSIAGNGESYTNKFNKFWVALGATVTGVATINNNVIVGGRLGDGTGWLSDLDNATSQAYCAEIPGANYCPTGATLAARLATAGVQADYTLSSASPYLRAGFGGTPIGYDRQQLLADQGVTQNATVVGIGDTYANVSYLAPDSRACYIDAVGASTGRTLDAGGGRERVTLVTGLTPSTAYSFRVMCYYEQVNDSAIWPQTLLAPWAASELTRVAATTRAGAAAVSTPIAVAFSGAADLRVTGTLADGSTLTPVVCTSSPCSVSLKPGRNDLLLTFRTGGAATIRSGPLAVTVQ